MKKRPLCLFGEVLFDHFPDGSRVLGGAPFNVAWHLQAFGQAPHFISRVGDDPEGRAIRTAMHDWGMDIDGLQTDAALPTGKVIVDLVDGEPQYDIVRPCAYDAIALPDPPLSCGLLYHGSLALREATSAGALAGLRAAGPATVFVDVNLRPPWWHREALQAMLRAADWVKLNADELATLAPGGDHGAERFIDDYGLRALIVTRGAAGAEVLTADGERHRVAPQPSTTIVDTVGAGDAFASVMILGILLGWPAALSLERAQQFASRMVGNRGATVQDPSFYQSIAESWQIDV